MEHNQFLRSFMSMRASLHKSGEKGAGIVGKKETKEVPNPEGITIAHIVENKPPEKEVVAYFQARCAALNAEN